MKEFGSDFHYISRFQSTGNTLDDFRSHANGNGSDMTHDELWLQKYQEVIDFMKPIIAICQNIA